MIANRAGEFGPKAAQVIRNARNTWVGLPTQANLKRPSQDQSEETQLETSKST